MITSPRRLVAFTFFLPLAALPMSVSPQDTAGALAAVERIFEGMRAGNADMVRAMFASDARFALIDVRDGPARVVVQGVDGWIRSIGTSGGRWDEQIYDVEVRVDGAMASVWAPYTFYLDGAVRHCGINSIELLRDEDGWKVTQLSDTRRVERCPDPLGG